MSYRGVCGTYRVFEAYRASRGTQGLRGLGACRVNTTVVQLRFMGLLGCEVLYALQFTAGLMAKDSSPPYKP